MTRALDRDLHRDVAIKELLSRTATSETRFLREALITARLEHPGIVPVHEAGCWPDGTPFYAMKLVAGRPLRDLIAERSSVTERLELLHHVIAVADAIAYAHGRNIIHRDLKPGNVVVGAFGETVVIDWGLAKDLSQGDDEIDAESLAMIGGELTAAGNVVGTPAYMSPEQARGEHVDQRTDVYAIGAMLWELCSLHKVPPTARHHRHRLMRNAGVDADLITIIDRCLAPSPQHRYADAAALASDLRAFKAGARIAARDYSLLGILTHWARRHQALAVGLAIVMILAVAGVSLYVHAIASERSRTASALQIAQATKRELSRQHDELILKHAESLLSSDPSAALDILKTYDGSDGIRLAQLRAEAIASGTASLRVTPHTELVRMAVGRADRSIFSTSIDGTITRTSPEGKVKVLATNASSSGRYAYSAARRLLAYACDPSSLCLWDVDADVQVPIAPMLLNVQLAGLAISPRGTALALLAHSGAIQIVDIRRPATPVLRSQLPESGVQAVMFIDEDTLLTKVPGGVEVVQPGRPRSLVELPDSAQWDNTVGGQQVAISTASGAAVILDVATRKITQRAQLCHGALAGFRYLHRPAAMAFACREGTVGTWSVATTAIDVLGHLDGHADILSVNDNDEYVLAGGGNGMFAVFDLRTGLTSMYRGHGTRLTWISAPTTEYPYFLTGDIRGAMRVWPVPPRIARTIANTRTRIVSAFFHPDQRRIVATTFKPELTVIAPNEQAEARGPHLGSLTFSAVSPDASSFATFGASDVFEIWSMSDLRRLRQITTRQGMISDLKFMQSPDRTVTAGRDGSVMVWDERAQGTVVMRVPGAAEKLAVAPATLVIVASTSDGSLWSTTGAGTPVHAVGPGPRITQLVALPDRRHICLGRKDGEIVILDTMTGSSQTSLHAADSPRDIVFSRDGRHMVVATNDDRLHIGTMLQPGDMADTAWITLPSRARKVLFARDDTLLLAGNDGMVSVFDLAHRRWISVAIGTTDFSAMSATSEGDAAAVFDRDGRAVWLDLASAERDQQRSNEEIESTR